jgi:hypothetical protein
VLGAIIVTHSFIARGSLAPAEFLLQKIERIVKVSIDFNMNAREAGKIINMGNLKKDWRIGNMTCPLYLGLTSESPLKICGPEGEDRVYSEFSPFENVLRIDFRPCLS